jgi:hypothetical protein
MGWWKCNERGQIDTEKLPTGHPGEHALINAIPNRDSTEDYYNGDGPADVMGVPLAFLKVWFHEREQKPTADDLVALFVDNEPREIFGHINKVELDKVIQRSWEMVDNEYLEAWSRKAYPEERRMVARFVFSGASSDTWKDQFWHLRERDKRTVQNAAKGIWGLG